MQEIPNVFVEGAEDMSISELKEKIKELDNKRAFYNANQLSIKDVINSMYGVYANKYFYFFNNDVAGTITGQGRDIIQTTKKYVNNYFNKKWHTDKKLHQKMGLTRVEPIRDDISVYGDTDSIFISLYGVYQNTDGWEGTEVEFIQAIYKYRLKTFLKLCFDKYAASKGTENLLNLELEKIAHSGIFLTKKKYVLDYAWAEPDNHYDTMEEVKATGGDLKSKDRSQFVKDHIWNAVNYILEKNVDFDMKEFLKIINRAKEEFKLQIQNDKEVISLAVTVNNYENYVIGDTKEIELKKGVPYQVRAASYYNWMLNYKHPEVKTKYRHITSGNKVKYYFAKTGNSEFPIFAYHPNEFPYEIAPEVDFTAQFKKTYLEPVNRFLDAIGKPKISQDLLVRKTIF